MKTATKKLSKKAAAVEIAAILRRVGGGVDLEQCCLVAVDMVGRERDVARLRRHYSKLKDEFPSWDAFVKDAIEVGEWNREWGMPAETD